MAKKLVLFDCDGVLINTEELGYKVVSDLMKDMGMSYTREQYVEMLSGITYEQFFQNFAKEYKAAKGEELPATFREQVRSGLRAAEDAHMKAIDGVREMLENLQQHDIEFAVCSNSGAENLLYKLQKTGLFDYFVPRIYSRHHVENPKPAPDMYLLAAKNFGYDPKNCLVVEDSITGTMAGVAAGMTVIGFIGEAHRDSSEADLLTKAGAKLIAMHPDDVWGHVAQQSGIDPVPRFPFYGPDVN